MQLYLKNKPKGGRVCLPSPAFPLDLALYLVKGSVFWLRMSYYKHPPAVGGCARSFSKAALQNGGGAKPQNQGSSQSGRPRSRAAGWEHLRSLSLENRRLQRNCRGHLLPAANKLQRGNAHSVTRPGTSTSKSRTVSLTVCLGSA